MNKINKFKKCSKCKKYKKKNNFHFWNKKLNKKMPTCKKCEKERGSLKYDKWLKKNNYPEGYRVLCANCNWAMRYGKVCPHEQKRTEGSNSSGR